MDEAKKLFMKYDGSFCQMKNDGCYENYKQYNISKFQETEWRNELFYEQKRLFLNSSENNKLYFCKMCLIARSEADFSKADVIVDCLHEACIIEKLPLSTVCYMCETVVDALVFFDAYGFSSNSINNRMLLFLSGLKNKSVDLHLISKINYLINKIEDLNKD